MEVSASPKQLLIDEDDNFILEDIGLDFEFVEDDLFTNDARRKLSIDWESTDGCKPVETNQEIPMEVKYPRAVFFIISNEFCERFSFYGMRAILSLYLHKILHYSNDTSTVIYHSFLMACYFFPLVGAVIADSIFGKFRTIFYLSIVYAAGNLTLALASMPYLGTYQSAASILGLFFVAFGTGGIKPCVSAFGGDQFVVPQQERQLQQFFSVFYFAINAGSLVSMYVTPYIRYNVYCFGNKSCYPLAFGVPAMLMAVAVVIFVAGKPFYRIKKPRGNILIQVIKCISHALINKAHSKEKKSHWLNYAEDEYDTKLIEEIKSVLRVLLLFLPLPAFWALFDQQGSRWTFQAINMDGSLGWLGSIKPEQIQIINPLLILILIPLFEAVVYPVLAKVFFIRTPLQKMSTGGLLTALSFVASGILELYLQDTYAVLPQNGIGQIRFYNGLNCAVNLSSNSSEVQGTFDAYDELEITNIAVNKMSSLPFSIQTNCSLYETKTWTGMIPKIDNPENVAISYLITTNESNIDVKLLPLYDDVTKSSNGHPKLRVIYDVDENSNLTLINTISAVVLNLKENEFSIPISEMPSFTETYDVNIGGVEYGAITLEVGGVYTLLVVNGDNDDLVVKTMVTQPPNSIHILWQIPQYVIITAAEVMVSVTGLELSYSQAPASMKSVLSAIWLLTTSLGNLLVIIIAELKFYNQAVEFFTFAILMTLVMGIFIYIATQYKYVNTSKTESEEDLPDVKRTNEQNTNQM